MPPKVPINGFAVFMYEMKDRRRLNMSGGQLATFCGPLWKELSAAEKKQYDARAKELKGQKKGAEGDMSRRDNVGNIIGMRKNPEEETRKRRQRDQDMVTREWPRKDLTEERFYFINFQELCELTEPDNTTEREWLPREFAIVEFSLRHGIMQHYHVFINPGGIPKGFRYTCIQKSEETHRIPIEDFEHDIADYSLIWRKMKEVMRAGVKDGLYPPVFCLVFVTNTSTLNPTKVNDNELTEPYLLVHQDVITITDRSFRFEFTPDSKHHPDNQTISKSPKTPRSRSPAKTTPAKIVSPKTRDVRAQPV